jgi:hypothetical protein
MPVVYEVGDSKPITGTIFVTDYEDLFGPETIFSMWCYFRKTSAKALAAYPDGRNMQIQIDFSKLDPLIVKKYKEVFEPLFENFVATSGSTANLPDKVIRIFSSKRDQQIVAIHKHVLQESEIIEHSKGRRPYFQIAYDLFEEYDSERYLQEVFDDFRKENNYIGKVLAIEQSIVSTEIVEI